jgi:hypothetical protein
VQTSVRRYVDIVGMAGKDDGYAFADVVTVFPHGHLAYVYA